MTRLGFRRALGLGATSAFSRAAPPVLLALAAAAVTLCTTLLWVTGLASFVSAGARVRFWGVVLAAVVAWMLQACVLGGAVVQAGAAARRRDVPGLPEAIVLAAPRALGWAVLAAAALLAWTGWQLLLGGSAVALFLRGLLHRPGGLAGAFGLALVMTAGPAVGLLVQLVAEMAVVRAVLRDEPASLAGWEAGRALLQRPWAPLGLWLLTEVLAAAVAGTAAALSGMSPGAPLRLAGLAALVQVAIATLARALAQLVRLGAFCALELDRSNELPPAPSGPAPRAELVLETGPILEARAVGPSSEVGG
ncbi:MAG: hypothetical protein ACLQDQ_00215 [Myxococcaceae bacterium]